MSLNRLIQTPSYNTWRTKCLSSHWAERNHSNIPVKLGTIAIKVREKLLKLAKYMLKMDTEQLFALMWLCKNPSEMQESGLFINRCFRFCERQLHGRFFTVTRPESWIYMWSTSFTFESLIYKSCIQVLIFHIWFDIFSWLFHLRHLFSIFCD